MTRPTNVQQNPGQSLYRVITPTGYASDYTSLNNRPDHHPCPAHPRAHSPPALHDVQSEPGNRAQKHEHGNRDHEPAATIGRDERVCALTVLEASACLRDLKARSPKPSLVMAQWPAAEKVIKLSKTCKARAYTEDTKPKRM